jgi:8-oxo-dGTP diphosphatase
MPSHCYDFPRPMVTTDILLFSWMRSSLHVLLIRRRHDPFSGYWAFPGGFVDMDESLGHAALRELAEETSLDGIPVEQFHTFGDPGRDPRGRTVTVAYIALLRPEQVKEATAGDDAEDVGWFYVRRPPRLAFDHGEMLRQAVRRLRRDGFFTAISLLGRRFTLEELQSVYEGVVRTRIDASRFRRVVSSLGILREVKQSPAAAARGTGRLYRLAGARVRTLREKLSDISVLVTGA